MPRYLLVEAKIAALRLTRRVAILVDLGHLVLSVLVLSKGLSDIRLVHSTQRAQIGLRLLS